MREIAAGGRLSRRDGGKVSMSKRREEGKSGLEVLRSHGETCEWSPNTFSGENSRARVASLSFSHRISASLPLLPENDSPGSAFQQASKVLTPTSAREGGEAPNSPLPPYSVKEITF